MANFVNNQGNQGIWALALFAPQPEAKLYFRCVVEAGNAVRAIQLGAPLPGNICTWPSEADNICVIRKHCKAHQIIVSWHDVCRSHIFGGDEALLNHKAQCRDRQITRRTALAKEQAWINLYQLVNGPNLPVPPTPYTNHGAWIATA